MSRARSVNLRSDAARSRRSHARAWYSWPHSVTASFADIVGAGQSVAGYEYCWASCLTFRQHPGADLGFQHLADFGAWKVIPDFNLLGCFDAPDSLLHEGRYRDD